MAGPRPGSGGSGHSSNGPKGTSPPKEISPTGSVKKPDDEYWEGTSTSGGYYDENGEWVEANGYYDENGYWIETGGYYDDSGAWIEYAGYYDDNGEWVEVENAQQQQQQEQTYYDDGGGGGGGGTIETNMPTVVEEEPVEDDEDVTEDLNNTADHFLAVAGVAVTMPPKQSTPATKQSVTNRHGDDSCSSSYTDEAGGEEEEEDHYMEDLEEDVPDVISGAANMSKQQSEDHSNAESKGSGKTGTKQYESEYDENTITSEHLNDGETKLVEHDGEQEEHEEEEEAKDTLEDIMAKRKIAGNKGWSALSKTLRDRKSDLLEAAAAVRISS